MKAPGQKGHVTAVMSVFSGGRILVTARAFGTPTGPRALAQAFPRASIEQLLAEHRFSLEWLAAHGDRPLALDGDAIVQFVVTQRQRSRERWARRRWTHAAAICWFALRRRSYHLGPVRDGVDVEIDAKLNRWRST